MFAKIGMHLFSVRAAS